jgi:UDP-GlcNAc:undecaprenyl-phosphate GlcNAc-1-phosphate transferase
VAFVATKVAIHVSFRMGVLDRPNERSSHHEPTPRLGGLGILASAAIVYGVCIALGNLRVVPYPVLSPEKMAMLGAGLAMAAIGLYDDLHHLAPGFKLLAQLFLALVIVGLGYRIEDLALAGWGPIALGWLSFPLTILWFAGFSNSFNFMDGINGMSAVTAATNFLFLRSSPGSSKCRRWWSWQLFSQEAVWVSFPTIFRKRAPSWETMGVCPSVSSWHFS